MIRMRWLARLLKRATHAKLATPPDYVARVGGEDYLRRWHIVPRNRVCNIYLHEFVRSDAADLHDHPYASASIVLDGMAYETLRAACERTRLLLPGDVALRRAATLHRIALPQGQTCRTLFVTGPRIRDWGFEVGGVWKPWREVITADGANGSKRKGP